MSSDNNSNTLVVDIPKFEQIEAVHSVSPKNRFNQNSINGTPIYRSSSEWVCFYHDQIDFLCDGHIVSLWNGIREIKLIIMMSDLAYKISTYERIMNPRDFFVFGYVMDDQPVDSPYQKSHLILFRIKYIFKTYF